MNARASSSDENQGDRDEGRETLKDGPGSRVLVGESDHSDHVLKNETARTFPDQRVARTSRGLTLPALGLGTWQLDSDEAAFMVEAALGCGFRHIDTAQMYKNESDVGRGIKASGVERDDLFLTTKIANENHEPDDLVRSVERSLDALQTDHVDLLLIHWPTSWPRIGATLSTMADVQASGLAHHIGVSNFTIEQLEIARQHAPIEVLQAECHPYFHQYELRQWCVDHDWIFTAYSPIAQGRVADDQVLSEIGERHEASATQVSLAWLQALPNVAAIPRTSAADHLSDNWQSRHLELSEDEIHEINALDRGLRLVNPAFAPW